MITSLAHPNAQEDRHDETPEPAYLAAPSPISDRLRFTRASAGVGGGPRLLADRRPAGPPPRLGQRLREALRRGRLGLRTRVLCVRAIVGNDVGPAPVRLAARGPLASRDRRGDRPDAARGCRSEADRPSEAERRLEDRLRSLQPPSRGTPLRSHRDPPLGERPEHLQLRGGNLRARGPQLRASRGPAPLGDRALEAGAAASRKREAERQESTGDVRAARRRGFRRIDRVPRARGARRVRHGQGPGAPQELRGGEIDRGDGDARVHQVGARGSGAARPGFVRPGPGALSQEALLRRDGRHAARYPARRGPARARPPRGSVRRGRQAGEPEREPRRADPIDATGPPLRGQPDSLRDGSPRGHSFVLHDLQVHRCPLGGALYRATNSFLRGGEVLREP